MEFGNGTIHRWDKVQPTADKLIKVAQFFNVSLDYLLGIVKCLPSKKAMDLAYTYDKLLEEKKNLIDCYFYIVQRDSTSQA
jgi:hypothetical protein